MTRTSWIGSIIRSARKQMPMALLGLVLAGCAGVSAPAHLPFPEGPALHGHPGTAAEAASICFSREDAVALSKWLDKLEAFKHAYERRR